MRLRAVYDGSFGLDFGLSVTRPALSVTMLLSIAAPLAASMTASQFRFR